MVISRHLHTISPLVSTLCDEVLSIETFHAVEIHVLIGGT